MGIISGSLIIAAIIIFMIMITIKNEPDPLKHMDKAIERELKNAKKRREQNK